MTKKKSTAPRAAKLAGRPLGDAPPQTLVAAAEALAEVLERHQLTEIEAETADLRMRVTRGRGTALVETAPPAAPGLSSAPPPAAAPVAATSAASTTETSDGNVSYITSPFVGTFYRSPNPESAPFVDVGTHVKKGQVLCIVEAMKLMNEIESEVTGTIVALLVENGQPVEYGEPLFKIKQSL
jgi:acetyl-CoA carboxylase biotin carboxyl carrier protein